MAHLRPASDPWCLWLRDQMTTMGLTPKHFATQMGLTTQAIYWWMQDGGTLPPDARIPRLAVLLGCTEERVRKAIGSAWKHRGSTFASNTRAYNHRASASVAPKSGAVA